MSNATNPDQPCGVLFLCTQNSARSVLAECIANRLGAGKLKAFSAGSKPRGGVHPLALELLRQQGYDSNRLRSKSWDEFARPGAPPLDLVITVCDAAAGETCPVWPGAPMRAHWGLPDPAAVPGGETVQRHAFMETYRRLEKRIGWLLAMLAASAAASPAGHDRTKLQGLIADIGRLNDAAPKG